MAALNGQKTFLEIQTECADECGGVTIAALQRPSLSVLKRLINDAERELCSMWDWYWLYREFSFNTVIGQQTAYALDDTAAMLKWMAVPAQQARIIWKSMAEWEALYPGRYNSAGPTRPWIYIDAPVAANMALSYFLFPAADQVYNVTYGAKLRVGNMVADGDYPVIPVDWQGMLIAKAKAKYLEYLGISSSDPRIGNYEKNVVSIYNNAWMDDQIKGETMRKFRDAQAERALEYSGFGNFANFVWVSGNM